VGVIYIVRMACGFVYPVLIHGWERVTPHIEKVGPPDAAYSLSKCGWATRELSMVSL
jgi:hypothetical protein